MFKSLAWRYVCDLDILCNDKTPSVPIFEKKRLITLEVVLSMQKYADIESIPSVLFLWFGS